MEVLRLEKRGSRAREWIGDCWGGDGGQKVGTFARDVEVGEQICWEENGFQVQPRPRTEVWMFSRFSGD